MIDDHDLLIRLDEKLDNVLARMGPLERRVTVLEEWKWKWAGAMAVGVFLINFLGTVAARALTP